jgi:hypothetical protein
MLCCIGWQMFIILIDEDLPKYYTILIMNTTNDIYCYQFQMQSAIPIMNHPSGIINTKCRKDLNKQNDIQ